MIALDELKKFFKTDGFVQNCGFEIIQADEKGSVVKVQLNKTHINAAGTVHGGLLFSLTDFAFGVAANCVHPLTLTSSASITYVAPCADSEYLIAECSEVSRYHRTCVYSATVKDDKGDIICIAQLNGFIKE